MQVDVFALRPAVVDDAAWFAPRLRQSDEDEVLAIYENVEHGMREAIASSEMCMVAELDGRPVFVIGCANGGAFGIPWLLATGEVIKHPGALTKITKHYVAMFLERWPVLENYVDERNAVSVKWLKALGFEIQAARRIGRNGEFFHPFNMRA